VVAVLFRPVTRYRDTIIEVVGNALRRCTEQIGATAVNVGVMFGLTTIVNVAVVAH
jgi:hypothetical protein